MKTFQELEQHWCEATCGSSIERFIYKEMKTEIEKLQKFKDYVHDRLDKMGISVDPESPHKEAGCRIGGRLDIGESRLKVYERHSKAQAEYIQELEDTLGIRNKDEYIRQQEEHARNFGGI
jgi:transposase